jgi:hypothetical protein
MKKTGKIVLRTLTNNRLIHLVGDGELDGAAILTGLLKTVYKLDQKAIDSILQYGKIVKDGETSTDVATADSVLATITGLDTARVKTLNDKIEKDKFQEGYKKAKSEVLTTAEKEKKERYGITSDLTGQELDDFIISEKLKEAGATGEDAIKKSPTYIQLETKMKKELQDLKTASDKKLQEVEASYKKEGIFTKVGANAIDILTGLNPVLPKNATVAETYKKDFLNELKGYEYEMQDDGTIIVSKEGKRLEDAHGNALSYEEHVKKIAGNRFEFAANNGGENGGGKNDPNGGEKGKPATYPPGINKPKTDEELAKIMSSDIKPEEKRVVLTEYQGRTAAK